MKTSVLLVRKIPPRLRAKFKSACAARGRTMQEVIESLLRLYVDRPAVIEANHDPRGDATVPNGGVPPAR